MVLLIILGFMSIPILCDAWFHVQIVSQTLLCVSGVSAVCFVLYGLMSLLGGGFPFSNNEPEYDPKQEYFRTNGGYDEWGNPIVVVSTSDYPHDPLMVNNDLDHTAIGGGVYEWDGHHDRMELRVESGTDPDVAAGIIEAQRTVRMCGGRSRNSVYQDAISYLQFQENNGDSVLHQPDKLPMPERRKAWSDFRQEHSYPVAKEIEITTSKKAPARRDNASTIISGCALGAAVIITLFGIAAITLLGIVH